MLRLKKKQRARKDGLQEMLQRSKSYSSRPSSAGQAGVTNENIVTSPVCMMKAFAELNAHADEEPVDTPDSTTDHLAQKWKNFRLKVKENSKHYSSVTDMETSDRFYHYALIVSLAKNSESGVLEPTIQAKYPEKVVIPESVPLFCYPDLDCDDDLPSENYSFVITDETGNRHYGHCKRTALNKEISGADSHHAVICIVGPGNASKLYQKVLSEFERMCGSSYQRATSFLEHLHKKPLPGPGKSMLLSDQTSSDHTIQVVTLSRAEDVLRDAVDYEALFQRFSTKLVSRIFASLLLERRVIFISSHLSILSSTIDTFTSMLCPLAWQHTLVPVLPTALLEVTCSPTPYLVGIHSANAPELNKLDIDEVLLVDLDTKAILRAEGDEKHILPKRLSKVLMDALSKAKNMVNIPNTPTFQASLEFFKEAIGRYRSHIGYNKQGERCFDYEAFISGASSCAEKAFLKWFTETQMFRLYIQDKAANHMESGQDPLDKKLDEDLEQEVKVNQEYIRAKGRRYTAIGLIR